MAVIQDKITVDLYLRHRGELVSMARAIVGCPMQAEDIVQEAFFKYTQGTRSSDKEKTIGYLVKMVKNLSLDLLRRTKTENRVFDTTKADLDIEDYSVSSLTPESAAVQSNQYQKILAVLEELPRETQLAVIMHLVEGYNLRDIAKKLDISLGKAHAIVKDGTLHCRERLINILS